VLDTITNSFMFQAFNQSSLILVSVVEALYPAATVALAVVWLREACGPRRALGLAGGLAAIVWLVLGA
jgi:drug/metabolite transporter (DMT)-like permease